jgi:hypothetical protein
MKLFACQACGQLLYFENLRCGHCSRALGYLPDLGTMSSLEPKSDGGWTVLAAPQKAYKFCDNARYGVCNWMLPDEGPGRYCTACRHNHLIPDLSVPGNGALWARMEAAKHRLFYTLINLHLPLANRIDDPLHGLAFDFLADPPMPHAAHVVTGHNNGLITLALKEADDAVREQVREAMGEPYRTLLGHFRHESGHYFWDRLVAPDPETLKSFRALFGDEREDYAAGLKKHYADGAPPDWQENFLSAYASAHPWEDFAESWAHYLHIVDTLETAAGFDLSVVTRRKTTRIDFDPHNAASMQQLIDAWLPITFTVNGLNRSMGQPDLYPFILAPRTIAKLGFIHALTHRQGGRG